MAAWTRHLARRWHRSWYWHPQVRPAYTEVTWLWTIYFLLRVILQLTLFQEQQVTPLAGINLVMIGQLQVCYLSLVTCTLLGAYGNWRAPA